MAVDEIPLIEARGTHREVGQQIGEQMRPTLERMLPRLREGWPAGVESEDVLLQGQLYLAPSRAVYRDYVAELGIAEGAGLSFEEVFRRL